LNYGVDARQKPIRPVVLVLVGHSSAHRVRYAILLQLCCPFCRLAEHTFGDIFSSKPVSERTEYSSPVERHTPTAPAKAPIEAHTSRRILSSGTQMGNRSGIASAGRAVEQTAAHASQTSGFGLIASEVASYVGYGQKWL